MWIEDWWGKRSGRGQRLPLRIWHQKGHDNSNRPRGRFQRGGVKTWSNRRGSTARGTFPAVSQIAWVRMTPRSGNQSGVKAGRVVRWLNHSAPPHEGSQHLSIARTSVCAHLLVDVVEVRLPPQERPHLRGGGFEFRDGHLAVHLRGKGANLGTWGTCISQTAMCLRINESCSARICPVAENWPNFGWISILPD